MDPYTQAEQAFDLDIGQALNQGLLMGFGEGDDLGSLADSLDFEVTPGALAAFDQAAIRFLADNRGTARKRIVEEHFLDETEAEAFDILSEHLGAILNSKSIKQKAQSIEFVFDVSEQELCFDLCCQALGIRPWVIRTRMMYEFYLHGSTFESFPMWVMPMGDALTNELLFVAGEEGEMLAKVVWGMPSIASDVAIEQAVFKHRHRGYTHEAFLEALTCLIDRGYIGAKEIQGVERLYLIGRNPVAGLNGLMRGRPGNKARGFYWSDLWSDVF